MKSPKFSGTRWLVYGVMFLVVIFGTDFPARAQVHGAPTTPGAPGMPTTRQPNAPGRSTTNPPNAPGRSSINPPGPAGLPTTGQTNNAPGLPAGT